MRPWKFFSCLLVLSGAVVAASTFHVEEVEGLVSHKGEDWLGDYIRVYNGTARYRFTSRTRAYQPNLIEGKSLIKIRTDGLLRIREIRVVEWNIDKSPGSAPAPPERIISYSLTKM